MPSKSTWQIPQTSSSGISHRQVATAFHFLIVTFILICFCVYAKRTSRNKSSWGIANKKLYSCSVEVLTLEISRRVQANFLWGPQAPSRAGAAYHLELSKLCCSNHKQPIPTKPLFHHLLFLSSVISNFSPHPFPSRSYSFSSLKTISPSLPSILFMRS